MKKKPTTVYVPVKVEDELPKIKNGDILNNVFAITDYGYKFVANTIRFGGLSDDSDYPDFAEIWLKEQQLITFTPEEYNKFLEDFGKKLLKTAAENSRMTGIAYGDDSSITDYEVDKNSILEVLPKVLEKYKIKKI